MSGINRSGQKVSCIMELEVTDMRGNTYAGPVPVVGRTYTVDAFIDSRMVLTDDLPSVDSTFPGITLLELPPLRSRCGRIFGWPIMAFVPLLSRERFASISEMIDPRIREPA